MGEILVLMWAGVDLFCRTVIVFRSTNGERRTIPVNATVLDLLKDKYAVRPRTTDLVFHSHAHTTLDGDGFPGQSMPLKRTRSWWGVVQNFDGVAVEKTDRSVSSPAEGFLE
jgi:integrase